ncbi:permease [Paenibacillus pasadenensis]|uniref:Putative permease n=1 Tax=Paenibacillus pasadenensis TaxID=217090 RepID=A0A2N5NAD2_9BACL|nr:permease [Paenibacillus pasadenensis]PLT47302.1 putative permease [Paenibacillus pasadenensis]
MTRRLLPLLAAVSTIGAGAILLLIARRDMGLDAAAASRFGSVFIGILLEALPYLLLGVAISAVVQIYLSERLLRRLLPRHPLLAVTAAGLLGIVFPLCECGMIPAVRRLIRKGMPAYAGIAYILAGPVVNPVVFSSTWAAFGGTPQMAIARTGLAFAVAFAIGAILWKTLKSDPLKADLASLYASLPQEEPPARPFGGRLQSAALHATDEFFDMGKYLILGAALATLFQTAVSRSFLEELGGNQLLSHLFLMGVAFLLSLCSTSDAFVAASFGGSFENGALLAFLVFGPMIDLKSLLLLLASFRARTVLLVASLAAVFTLTGSWLLEAVYLP